MNLLEKIADQGVEIALVIEKCEDIPSISHVNIKVVPQRNVSAVMRTMELFMILRRLIKEGYTSTFVRVSVNSAIISIVASLFGHSKTFYWQSGTTYDVDKNKPFIQRIIWMLKSRSKMLFIKTFIHRFVTGPESMVDYYVTTLRVPRKRMLLLYNDIDVSRFVQPNTIQKVTVREELGYTENQKIILMVHRLSPVRMTDKYIPEIINDDFFKENDIKLIIVGDGPEKIVLEKKLDEYKLNDFVDFVGSVPNSMIEKYYAIADLFINPSFTEGFPRVVIEAMACGLPVVATNAGGTVDIFSERQKQYVVDKRDVPSFRNAIKELLSDETLLSSLSEENLMRVKRFSTEEVSKMYIEGIFKDG